MIRSLLFSLSLWAVATTAQAQHWASTELCHIETPQIEADALSPDLLTQLRSDATRVPNGVGRLWEITSATGAKSYLWGTQHSNNRHILNLPAQLTDLIRGARVAAFELDPVYTSRRHFELGIRNEAYFRPARAIPKEPDIDPEILGFLKSRLHGIGWGRDATKHLTLGALAEIGLTDVCNDFAAHVYPIQDSLLQTYAFAAGAEIIGLEPADSFLTHLNAPENYGLARDILTLYGSGLDPKQTNAERSTAIALYLGGENAVAMAWERHQLSLRFGEEEGAALQRRVDAYLLDQRNLRFVAALAEELQQGSVFVAVGSWHIPGELGMVSLLEQAGYKLKRIPVTGEAGQ